MKDCYAALGCIHGAWKPVLGRFKDYIAMPKFNLYQSLHTTVIGPGGRPLEVQIRTREMHQRAEWGVAAHWAYKEGSPSDDLAWLNRIIDWQADANDPDEFMENLKTDLEQDEVFVFTPKGRVITLPVGVDADRLRLRRPHRGRATPASALGSTGGSCPSTTALQSGDTCEIFTSKVEGAGRSRDWLKIVPSPAGPQQDPPVVPQERREDALESGRDELTGELRRKASPSRRSLAGDVLAREAARAQLHRPRRPVPGRRRAPGLGPVRRPAGLRGSSAAGRTTRSCRPPSAPPAGPARATATSASTSKGSTT